MVNGMLDDSGLIVKLNLGDLGQVMVKPSSKGCVRSINATLLEVTMANKFRKTIENIFLVTRKN